MTELDLYTNALIEQNKQEAPTLTIEEFNYLINKAIVQYINLTYARFDLNQQSSDDLRWLQRSAVLDIEEYAKIIHPMESKHYECELPSDYLHMLNCTVHFTKDGTSEGQPSKCHTEGDDGEGGIYSLCRRLTANQVPAINQNAYLRPTYKRPYFYINEDYNPDSTTSEENNDFVYKTMEIRCGKDKGFVPDKAYVDYLKLPNKIELTWADTQAFTDSTQMCEFPDAVAYEIINLFIKLVLENASDDRLQTHFAVNQTIGGASESPKGK